MDKLVSIIVPAYNAEKYIRKTIESLLVQTYRNIEIIVIDDGSTDNTYNILKQITENDYRLNVFTIENNGVSNARNVGISVCNGDYIAFMDSDDYMEPTMIYKLVQNMKSDIDLVCCGYKIVSDTNEVLFEQKPITFSVKNEHAYLAIENMQEFSCMNVLWNKMFRANIIKKKCLKMDTSISMGEDLLFIIDYYRNMSRGIQIISDAEYRYTLSPKGLQASFSGEIDLRVKQLYRIKQLYDEKNYPLDGYYLEGTRVLYTLFLEHSKSNKEVEEIFNLPICKEIRECNVKCSGKYKLFIGIITIKNIYILRISIRLFKLMKFLRGRSYKW